jgi:3-phenylpropionate/trans-cinnamate dioxygenase ferredoxin subunit
MAWHAAANLAELIDDTPLAVQVAGEAIALYRLQGQVYATQDCCTHEFAPLSEGFIEGDCIECPLHLARFNIRTGAVENGPATQPVKTYPVRIENGRIMVDVG